jgi:hypothetical protein
MYEYVSQRAFGAGAAGTLRLQRTTHKPDAVGWWYSNNTAHETTYDYEHLFIDAEQTTPAPPRQEPPAARYADVKARQDASVTAAVHDLCSKV